MMYDTEHSVNYLEWRLFNIKVLIWNIKDKSNVFLSLSSFNPRESSLLSVNILNKIVSSDRLF